MPRLTRADAEAADARDDIAASRDEFVLPPGVVYLDGNSLGPLPRATIERMSEVTAIEWGQDLIRSWDVHGWIDMPERVAAKIAPLVGAAPDEVAGTDSTSVNLFNLLVGAVRLRPERGVIVSETANFPTDVYAASAVRELRGGLELRLVERGAIAAALREDVAVLMLTHVDFRTGEMHDLRALSAAAHDAGALVLWDLAHSAGAVPVDLDDAGADLAVGCGYKYLNGGPGAPAFAYVARHLQADFAPALQGWMGHAEPFAFDARYRPAAGVRRLRCGTPPVLSLAALECGVDTVARAGVDRLRRKSTALSDFFIGLVEQECGGTGLTLASPRDPARRGSQVSLKHPEGHAIVQALIGRGVVSDFRTPDVLRFGLAPAYLRFVDVWDAVRALRDVMDSRAGDQRALGVRRRVT